MKTRWVNFWYWKSDTSSKGDIPMWKIWYAHVEAKQKLRAEHDRWTERVIPIYPFVRFDSVVLEKNWHAKLKIRKKENILQNKRKNLPHSHPPLKTHVHLKLTKKGKYLLSKQANPVLKSNLVLVNRRTRPSPGRHRSIPHPGVNPRCEIQTRV